MFKNRGIWLMALAVLYVGLLGAEQCGKKADQQIKSAQAAIEDARAAEAPRYAPNEFKSAEESLDTAQSLFKKWSFKKSEEKAREAEDKARLAKQIALEQKAREDEELARLRELQRSSLDDSLLSAADMARMALKDVNFDFDSAALTPTAKSILISNAAFLAKHPHLRVQIEGHCDERGTEEYNLALGARRAKAVYDFLIQQGIPASRMTTISYGESLPLDRGQNEAAWAVNRRAHFAVLP